MVLPRRRSISVWFEREPARLLAVGILVLAVNSSFDFRRPMALLFLAAVVMAMFLKAFFDSEGH